MHIHILGIGGTFMAGIARLAVELGHRVTGADRNLYPPMSDQLRALGIPVIDGYAASGLSPAPDLVVIGNALARGNDSVEFILSNGLPYTSGPAWLAQEVLHERHVIAIAGTHGKTTVASLVTWMLEHAGCTPGFLVGGVLENFGVSARLGQAPLFVIEADEYDTALFDKRSKFIHYAPRTLVINNLEFDHADIFPDLTAIERQFHHLIRTLPREALIVRPAPDATVDGLLAQGVWSRVSSFGHAAASDWRCHWHATPTPTIDIITPAGETFSATTPLLGAHNADNTLAAIAAVADVGVSPVRALAALATFANVKRRLELRGAPRGVRVFDDFAHHPTAIAVTIAALRPLVPNGRIIAVTEMRSNTMRMGVHRETLAAALAGADESAILIPTTLSWDIGAALAGLPGHRLFTSVEDLIEAVVGVARAGDAVLVMSNGAFDDVHRRLLAALERTS